MHFAPGFTKFKIMEWPQKQGLMDRTSSTAFFRNMIAACWRVLYEELMALDASSLVVHILEVTMIWLCKRVRNFYYGVHVGRGIEIESDALKWSSRELRKHGHQVTQFIVVNCKETIYYLKFCAVSAYSHTQ